MCIKSSRHLYKLLNVFIVLLFLIPSVGYVTDAGHFFEIGVTAARQQQYHVALKAFRQAQAAGLSTPELVYNLAVVHYKLGQYDEASENFQRLTDDKQYSAIAFYNLGLVELKLQKYSAAEQWFKKAYALANDPQIIALAAKALDRLKGIEVPLEPASRSWSGFVTSDIVYDSNVSLIDEEVSQTQGISDITVELSATTSRILLGDANNGIRFSGTVDFLEHDTADTYDYSQWQAALGHVVKFNGWNFRSTIGTGQTRFASVDFQMLRNLELRARYELWHKTRLEMRYKYYDIEDLSPTDEYEYLQGIKQQLRTRVYHKSKNMDWKLSYSFEDNDRADYQTDTVFRSYSPRRHSFQVATRISLIKNFSTSFDMQYRYSNYQNADTTITNNILYKKIRMDHRYRFALLMEYKLKEDLHLRAAYRFTKNESNRDGSDYKRSEYTLGLIWYY